MAGIPKYHGLGLRAIQEETHAQDTRPPMGNVLIFTGEPRAFVALCRQIVSDRSKDRPHGETDRDLLTTPR